MIAALAAAAETLDIARLMQCLPRTQLLLGTKAPHYSGRRRRAAGSEARALRDRVDRPRYCAMSSPTPDGDGDVADEKAKVRMRRRIK